MRRLVFSLMLALTALAACAGTALGAKNLVGQVEEFELGAGTRPEALVTGPDGNLWFAGLRYVEEGFADVVGRVTPQGEVTEFTVATHAANVGLSDITAGPDGNLWFAVGYTAKVGRITPSGQVTEFQLPDPNARPASITTGPDGNLWFTQWQGGNIGRITPNGEVSEFPLRDGAASAGIAAGPDGSLWVTQPVPGRIIRVSTEGTETVFTPPSASGYPGEIISGPDGALWFGMQRGGALGRITTTGEATDLVAPGGTQTFALSSGPFDNIWYSNGGGRIGWTIPGEVTGEPACINSCQSPISDLTEGPDGKLWFAAGVEGGAFFTAPGTVGTYAPPPLEIRVLGDGELRNQTLRLPVRCRWTPAGSRCKGRLQLRGQGKLDERRLSLRIGGKRRVALRLPDSAASQLAARGRLVLRATTIVADGRRDTRRIVLRRR